MPKINSSILRRRTAADKRKLSRRHIKIRLCQCCERHGAQYILIKESTSFTECNKFNLTYNLTPPRKAIDKAYKVIKDLDNKILKVEAKAIRLRKQRKY